MPIVVKTIARNNTEIIYLWYTYNDRFVYNESIIMIENFKRYWESREKN